MSIGWGGKGDRWTDNFRDYPTFAKKLLPIDWNEVCDMVDDPPSTAKDVALWIIFNETASRKQYKQIEGGGQYTALWADIDKGDIPSADGILNVIKLFTNAADCEVYSTVSATSELNKSRVMIPLLNTVDLETWVACQKLLNAFLESNGISADEHNLEFTQICYLPNKGSFYDTASIRGFHFFDPTAMYKDEIAELKETYTEKKESGESNYGEKTALNEMIHILCTGESPYHQTQVKFSYGQVNDNNLRPNDVKKMMQGFMLAWKHTCTDAESLKRWQDRYNEIDKMVDNAVPKDKEAEELNWKDIDIEDFIAGRIKKQLPFPMPPGFLGEFVEELYLMQEHQYHIVAFVTAIGLLAGICGRRFNIDGLGLNVYMTILMGTGMGKDFIGKTITNILNTTGDMAKGKSFLGHKGSTAGKGIINSLQKKRSQVCIFTEAGMMFQSNAGDKASLVRAILDIYSKSGDTDWIAGEEYSKVEDCIEAMRSPALTIINESTPSTILGVLYKNNAIDNGLLPRQSLYRYEGMRPDRNIDKKLEMDKRFKDKIHFLINLCAPNQDDSSALTYVTKFEWFDLEEDMRLFSKECNVLFNDNQESHKGNMSTRLEVRAMKYAALATLFNHDHLPLSKDETYKGVPLMVGAQEWAWAKNVVLYEFNNTMDFFKDSDYTHPVESKLIQYVLPIIGKMLKKEYSAKQTALTPYEIKHNHIPWKKLAQALRKTDKLKFDGKYDTPTKGLEVIMQHCESMGYVDKIVVEASKYAPRVSSSAGYKATDVFIVKQSLLDLKRTKEERG